MVTIFTVTSIKRHSDIKVLFLRYTLLGYSYLTASWHICDGGEEFFIDNILAVIKPALLQ
jgi:hypothetical protein